MSDERMTDAPVPDNSRHVTTGVPPTRAPADWRSASTAPFKRPTVAWLCLRVVGTAAAAAAFVYVCWLMSGSVYAEPRMLCGPLGLFRYQDTASKVWAVEIMAVLLPCIFAVGVWRNAATIVLSVLALLCWVAYSFWTEAMASV